MGEAGNREDAAPYNYPHFDDHIARGGDVTDEAAFRDSPWAGQRAEDFTLLRLAHAIGPLDDAERLVRGAHAAARHPVARPMLSLRSCGCNHR